MHCHFSEEGRDKALCSEILGKHECGISFLGGYFSLGDALMK